MIVAAEMAGSTAVRRGRLEYARERRVPAPRTVLGVASLGVFMAFVDATIVNIAFPDIARSFPTASIGSLSWVLNAYNIVFAAFLLAGGAARRPARPAARLHARAGRVHGRVGAVRDRSVGRLADRRSACCRRSAPRCSCPSSLGARARGVPGRRAARTPSRCSSAVAALAAGRRPVARRRCWSPPSDWRLVFLVNLPVGVGGLRARAPPPCREPRAGPPADARPARRRRARGGDRRRSCSASSRARTGAGPTRASLGSFAVALAARRAVRPALRRAPRADRRPGAAAQPDVQRRRTP